MKTRAKGLLRSSFDAATAELQASGSRSMLCENVGKRVIDDSKETSEEEGSESVTIFIVSRVD